MLEKEENTDRAHITTYGNHNLIFDPLQCKYKEKDLVLFNLPPIAKLMHITKNIPPLLIFITKIITTGSTLDFFVLCHSIVPLIKCGQLN